MRFIFRILTLFFTSVFQYTPLAAQVIEPDSSLHLKENDELEEIVVSATLKAVSKSNSPIAIDVYRSDYFKKNVTATLFDALQTINGVRPQMNCNICNTGDIHINGLEGPYTLILIDGMPMISGLSSVYGLNGIPTSLIDRIEVVKGPASTLYGSEAVGGLINVITKDADKSPRHACEVHSTSWGEVNVDYATKVKVGAKANALIGINAFDYSFPIDNNGDGFTDVALQRRIALFNKWSIQLKKNSALKLAARYLYEDRWGGQMNWNKTYRGGNEIYGESITTKRIEFYGNYTLPVKENIQLQVSANHHDQNSAYGNQLYLAKQSILFGQLLWYKSLGRHDWVTGATYRLSYYDDNTPATANSSDITINQSSLTHLPGVFFQDEWHLTSQNTLLMGLRYDYNHLHGSILSPRLNYKWNSTSKKTIIRLGIGNGYRVAHLFTEDHAALTGARTVVFMENLKPERSWNGNLNIVQQLKIKQAQLQLDASVFYTYFSNKIIPDYETNVQQIIYANLDGHSVSRGISLNMDMRFPFGLSAMIGATLMDVYKKEDNIYERQLFTERFSATWNIGYSFSKWKLKIDYSGNVYSPMRLPLLGSLDPRPAESPWWSIQNIQFTKQLGDRWEIYLAVKNLLNWTPNKSVPFLLARAHDPFDQLVQTNPNGQVVATSENPYALTFDPSYVYAPNQGIRAMLGFRFNLK